MLRPLRTGVVCIWTRNRGPSIFEGKEIYAPRKAFLIFKFHGPSNKEDTVTAGTPAAPITENDPEEAYQLTDESQVNFKNDEIKFRKIDMTNKRQRVIDFDYTPRVRKKYIPEELDIQQLEMLGIHRPLAIKALR